MDKEVERLKKEVLILNARIKVLEGKEHRRSIFKSVKFLLGVVILSLVAFGIWRGYDYVTNYLPNYLEDKINDLNPFPDVPSSSNKGLTDI